MPVQLIILPLASLFLAVKWSFQLELERKNVTFEVTRIYRSRQIERFKIAPVGSNQSLIIQSDRPNIENRKLNKPVQWQRIEGYITDPYTLLLIYQEIERAQQEPPPPFQGTLSF